MKLTVIGTGVRTPLLMSALARPIPLAAAVISATLS